MKNLDIFDLNCLKNVYIISNWRETEEAKSNDELLTNIWNNEYFSAHTKEIFFETMVRRGLIYEHTSKTVRVLGIST